MNEQLAEAKRAWAAATEQLALFDGGVDWGADEDEAAPRTLRERFLEYHARHPEVYTALLGLARNWRNRAGRECWSINGMFEVLRWQRRMDTKDEAEPWKMNNNYRAFYARLLMEKHPDLEGLFEIRAQTSGPDFVPPTKKAPISGA